MQPCDTTRPFCWLPAEEAATCQFNCVSQFWLIRPDTVALWAASQLEQKDTQSQIYSLATEMRQECLPPPPTLQVHFIHCVIEVLFFVFLRVLQSTFKRWLKATRGPAIFGQDNHKLIGDHAAVSWFPLCT